MNPLYCVAEIRAIERRAAALLPAGALMQRAGHAAADIALGLLAMPVDTARLLVLAGPGNNGGDAFEAAARLANAGAQVAIVHLPGSGAASAERDQALQRARSSPAAFTEQMPGTGDWHLVIDGLFGIGLQRPIGGAAREIVDRVNALPCPVLALDVPSGLDADAGCVVGPDGPAVRATHTVTFIGDKPGLHTCDGRDYAGVVLVSDLGLDAGLLPPSRMHLNDVALFAHHVHARRHNTHKGSFGNVAVLGGAAGMAGAPVLAGRAALHAGAGRVFLCFAGAPLAIDGGQPELMCRAAQGFDFATAVTVAGPGLGDGDEPSRLLAAVIAETRPLVLDADALNLLAGDASLRDQLRRRSAAKLATPHPLEAARLLAIPVAKVQADRLAAARTLADQLQAIVVLKGSGTVIAAPDGRIVINTTGNPALATAGTGDVLSGLAGALLAQGWPGWEGALAAVWLHGTAGDMLVSEGVGPIGLTAGELMPAIRRALNRLVAAETTRGGRPRS